MKFFECIFFIILISCAQPQKKLNPKKDMVAYDSISNGKIKASAIKIIDQSGACFHINIALNDFDHQLAKPSNWIVAWVDKNSKHYLLNVNQRDPASQPVQDGKSWKNKLKACIPLSKIKKLESIIIFPKFLTSEESEGLELKWQ